MKRVLIYFLVLLSLTSCHRKKKKIPPPVFPVTISEVVQKDSPIYIDTIGHVDPIVTVNVVSRVKGEITNVYFTEGQTVKEGDLLFAIDPRTFQATLDKEVATLAATTSRYQFAREKVLRYSGLTEEDFYSQVNFDSLTTDMKTFEAVMQQNQADIDDAKINLDYCWIYSPLNGRTGILQVDRGNVLKADESQTLVVINQMKPIYVTFSVPERDLVRIRKYAKKNDLTTIAAFEDFHKDAFTGKLQMIDNQVNEKTGMVDIRSIFENEDEGLWPHQFVRTRLILYVMKDALVIPYQAINMTMEGPQVFVVKQDQTVDMRKVELGERENGDVIILKGLQKGEKIVTEGLQNLFPNAHVSIKGTYTE